MRQSIFHQKLTSLAEAFAASVLTTIRGMSLDEVVAIADAPRMKRQDVSAAKRGNAFARRTTGQRRTAKHIDGTVNAILGVLKKKPGLRAEQIRAELGLARKDIDRPILRALAAKQIRKTGERRATRYFLA